MTSLSNPLSARQLKLILLAAVSFAVIAAVGALWTILFPVPTEDLMEIAWTHDCKCVDGWMDSLRANGFVVRDHELESLTKPSAHGRNRDCGASEIKAGARHGTW